MLNAVNTTDFYTILSIKKGIRAATAWFLNTGILGQFSLAKEMSEESGPGPNTAGGNDGE